MSGLPEPTPPAGWGYSYLDHSTGYYGAIFVLAALMKRRRTGRGCYIDLVADRNRSHAFRHRRPRSAGYRKTH